jgi:molecular chaperone DnaK (HSP70)
MAQPRFSIGIDLGTTNSALAFVPLSGEAKPGSLLIPQWDTLAGLAEEAALPSFLYLPEDAVAARLRGRAAGTGEWVVGRLARRKAAETPGRVVHSAKSWLCHHTADRSAPFLPWASEDLSPEQKISPVRASALILNCLRAAWNDRFAAEGFTFDDQIITIAVPASFDAAAQRLTVAAAEQAGFPEGVRLIEEPQAAFYCWLEQHDAARELWHQLPERDAGQRHVLVIDIGGGTSDFSLFELRQDSPPAVPGIRRVAVSEHILLGGDNIDLAIAHLVEARLAGERGQLAGPQWDHLVAACRDLKETVLAGSGPPDQHFAVSLPGRGSGLIAGTRTATVTRAELEGMLLEGFFPVCDARARPYRAQAALREWGLPYAADSAVTRHLADFIRDRPRVDAVLFNGGSLHPPLLRRRLCDQFGAWQDGFAPFVLENAEPVLAVARGAARSGTLVHRKAGRIAAGAAHAVFLEVHGPASQDGGAGHPALVCVLPHGASPEQLFEIADPALELRINRLVRFRAYSSSKLGNCRAGELLTWREGDFQALPPLQTIVEVGEAIRPRTSGTVPVRLAAKMNALGLVQISCVSADPAIQRSWPLEFNLRPREQGGAWWPDAAAVQTEPNAARDALEAARSRIGIMFANAPVGRDRVTAAGVLKSLERTFGLPRSEWNASLLRALWPFLEARSDGRRLSVDHEEAWLAVAGFLLRPGFGVAGDGLRIDSLWQLCEAPFFRSRRIKCQEYILWRRLAGGLPRERQEKLLAGEIDRVRSGKAPAEFVRLAGSLELIPLEMKTELASLFIDAAVSLARARRHCAPYLAALGCLLNRVPLHGGPETVVSAALVEQAYAVFRSFDWAEPELLGLQTLFLRAARVVGDRSLDVPKVLRSLIAGKLESSGVAHLRTAKIRGFVPVGLADRSSLYDEPLPPGLVLATENNVPAH